MSFHSSLMLVSGILFGLEFFADKIPGFDLVWNAALLAFAAGTQLPA